MIIDCLPTVLVCVTLTERLGTWTDRVMGHGDGAPGERVSITMRWSGICYNDMVSQRNPFDQETHPAHPWCAPVPVPG